MRYFEAIGRKIKSMPTPAKAAFVYTVASFITRGFHLFTTPLFTRVMTVEQIGVVANFSTWESFISTVCTLGLTSGAVNIALKEYKQDRIGFLKTSQTLTSCGTIFFAIIILLFYPVLKSVLGMPFHYLILMFICILFSASRSYWMSWQRYEYKYVSVFWITIGASIVSASMSLVAVLFAQSKGYQDLATIRLYCSSVITLGFTIPFFFIIFANDRPILKVNYLRFALIMGMPMIGHTLAKTTLVASDRIMIYNICGAEAVGYYSVLYTLSSLCLIVWESVNISLVPFLFQLFDDIKRNNKRINAVVLPILILFGVCSILLVIFAPEIVKMIASEKYISAIYVMPPIASGIYFTAMYTLYADIILYKKKTLYIMLCTVGAAIFNLVTNLIFIPIVGYIAAAYTTLASYILMGGVYFFVAKRLSGEQVYDAKKVWCIACGVVVLAMMCNLLYHSMVVRYMFAGILIMGTAFYRDYLITIWAELRHKPNQR